jgi:hypothetical protein
MSELAEALLPSLAWITVVNGESSVDCAGVIISADGHLLTEAAPSRRNTPPSPSASATAALRRRAGRDRPLTDLAVVRVDRDDLIPADSAIRASLKSGGTVLVLEPDETGKLSAAQRWSTPWAPPPDSTPRPPSTT